MPKNPPTRRVKNFEKMTPTTVVRQRIARCGIRVSEVGERRKFDRSEEGANQRVTSDPRNPQADFISPDSQSAVAAEYCLQNGMAYDAEASLKFADIDVRARREGSWRNRRGLVQHLQDAEAGLFTDIVFYKLSRLSRNIKDGIEIVKAFSDAGVTVHFVRDPIPPIDTSIGQLILVIYLWLAQTEADNIGDNVSDAISQKWREGKPHGQPHGWLLGQKQFEDHRRLVELGLEGRSYIEIARTLNKEQRLTPRGKLWSSSSISERFSLINIKKMQGIAVSGDMGDGSVEEIPHAWKPLINQEEADALIMLHHAVAERRMSASERPGARGRSPQGKHMLSKIAYCSVCGKQFSASSTSGYDGVQYPTYVCLEGKYGNPFHEQRGDRHIQIKTAVLEEAVLRVLRHELTLPPPEPSVKPPRKPTSKTRTVSDIDREMEQLALRRGEYGLFVVAKLMKDLADERARLEAIMDQAPSKEAVALVISKAGEDELLQKRAMVLAMIKSVTYPYYLPRGKAQTGWRNEVRTARIVLKNGREYLAPIYRLDFAGERAIIEATPDVHLPTQPYRQSVASVSIA